MCYNIFMKNFFETQKKWVIVTIIIIASLSYGAYNVNKTLKNIQKELEETKERTEAGITAYNCLAEGACALNLINKYLESQKK